MRLRTIWLFMLGTLGATSTGGAASAPSDASGIWQAESPRALGTSAANRTLTTTRVAGAHLDQDRLDQLLSQAPLEHKGSSAQTILNLPMPDGRYQRFQV